MIFLRAIPFSFAILWRYVLVLPILIVALTMLGIMGFIFMLISALISPIFTIMIGVALGVGATVVPVMVGMRLGLQSFEIRPKNTYFGVLIHAIGYGLFEAVCVLILIAMGVGLYILASPLTFETLGLMARMNEDQVVGQLTATSPWLTYGMVIATGLATMALRACLLVPFAGASIGADPSGRLHTPFYAFGHKFFNLLILTIVTSIGWAAVVPIAVVICAALGFADSLAISLAELERASTRNIMDIIGLEVVVFAGLCLFLYLWFFSLVCAGGVLSYRSLYVDVRQSQQEMDKKLEAQLKTDEPPMKNDIDMLDLVRSRMPGKKY